MVKYTVEMPVGFNYSAVVEANSTEEAIKKTIANCEEEHSFMNLEYDRENACPTRL